MTGAVVKGLLLLLCGVALAALVVLFRLCRFFLRLREENRRLRQVLLLESHMEREELEAFLKEAGFDDVTVTGDLTSRPPAPEEDRWIFRCRKAVNS